MNGQSLTGQWSGQFSYPRYIGPTTPFLARLQDLGGKLSGTIIEPDIVSGGTTIEAFLSGLRQGTSVDFTKTYGLPAPFGYENPVDYVGSVSSDGNTITGVWSLLEFDGTFEMHRDLEPGEQVEEQEEVALLEASPSSHPSRSASHPIAWSQSRYRG